jgi:hypothetical protein
MPQQPELRSPPLTASPAPLPGSGAGPISVPIPDSGLINGPQPAPAAGGFSGVEVGPDTGPAIIPISDGGSNQGGGAGQKPAPQRIPRWLERSELFLRVVLRMYIGVAVCYAPWSRLFWDQNPLFVQYPTLSIYAANGAVRGIISGLGLLNLWIAFHDAFRHRDG